MTLLAEISAWAARVGGFTAAAIVFALAALVLSRRRRRASRVAKQSVHGATAELERTLANLQTELERTREENRRVRALSAIATSIDLECVLSRALEAAGALGVADAAIVLVGQDAEAPLVATLGLSADEAARVPAGGPPPENARAIDIAYRPGAEPDDAEAEPIRGGLVLPLRNAAGEAIGTLSVFWRRADGRPSDDEVRALEDVASTAGPAIENGRRFREARRLADLDALTSLHNRRYFHETLEREVARAQRYDRRLSLVIFDIDDFKAINERVGHLAGDAVLAELAERIRSVVRSADVACRVGGDEFAVILPESTVADGEHLYRRLQLAISSQPTGPAGTLEISAGVAELTAADDAVSFFERADDALFRAKDTGKDQAVAADG